MEAWGHVHECWQCAEANGQLRAPAALPPWEVGWVPKPILDAVEKRSLLSRPGLELYFLHFPP
jgi:hypothetical protein